MSRARNIKDNTSIVEVLADLGYHVHAHGGDREQQFSCDLHGDGSDSKPSARVYPDSNSWYCFACGKVRDAISTVREKWGYSFPEACKYLEDKYGVDYTPSAYSQGSETEAEEDRTQAQWEQEIKRTEALLTNFSRDFQDRSWLIPLWEGFDYLTWQNQKKGLTPLKGLESLREKAIRLASMKVARGDL